MHSHVDVLTVPCIPPQAGINKADSEQEGGGEGGEEGGGGSSNANGGEGGGEGSSASKPVGRLVEFIEGNMAASLNMLTIMHARYLRSTPPLRRNPSFR